MEPGAIPLPALIKWLEQREFKSTAHYDELMKKRLLRQKQKQRQQEGRGKKQTKPAKGQGDPRALSHS
jgi:hypothetical protein